MFFWLDIFDWHFPFDFFSRQIPQDSDLVNKVVETQVLFLILLFYGSVEILIWIT